jgi:hypothetical protein
VITVAPGKHRMPRRRDMARAALSAANQRPAVTDPDWPPGGAGSWPQWDGPLSLHPDHPSAPVPRVRPAPGGNGHRQDAEQDTAAIRQEAAHLRAVILSLSEQLSQMSAYITENFASPGGGLATMPAPAITPPRPRTTPASKPQPRPRQYNAMRIATAATATLFSFAAITGATELGLHGFKFFVFRAGGTGETAGTVGTDQQFLAHQAAAAKAGAQNAHKPGRHSAETTSGQ